MVWPPFTKNSLSFVKMVALLSHKKENQSALSLCDHATVSMGKEKCKVENQKP